MPVVSAGVAQYQTHAEGFHQASLRQTEALKKQ